MTIPDLMSSQREGGVGGTADVCITFSRLIYGCCCDAEIRYIPLFETGDMVKSCGDSQSQVKMDLQSNRNETFYFHLTGR